MKIIVGRPINGISLNGLEYLMNDDNSSEKEFDTVQDAKQFLLTNGCEDWTDGELEDSFMFIDTDKKIENKEIGQCEYCCEIIHENDPCFEFDEDGHKIMFCCIGHKEEYIYDLKH
jgi:hypothetical protein